VGEKELPALVKGQGVGCEEMTCLAHSTRPPARFTEASFVKELEAQVQFKGELEGVVIF